VLIPGIAGMAIMANTFSALAFNLTFLREQGILKRMRGTPLPTPVYVGGILASVVTNAVVQVLLVVVIGNVAYGVDWPQDWAALALFTALGVLAFGALGIAFSHLIPNFDSAAAYVNAIFLPAIFISGVFYSADALPRVLKGAAEALPLKHLIDGLSAAIVTGDGLGGELTAIGALAMWATGAVVLAVRGFRWE
jgi:ABC-2 type transport system permease protein